MVVVERRGYHWYERVLGRRQEGGQRRRVGGSIASRQTMVGIIEMTSGVVWLAR